MWSERQIQLVLVKLSSESYIFHQLKNKPHPRWTDAGETTLLHHSPGSLVSSPKSPPYVEPDLVGLPSLGDMAWADLLNWDSPKSSDSYSQSPVSTPSPLPAPSSRRHEPSPPLVHNCHGSRWSAENPRKCDTGCDCLNEPACYNTAVDLASELYRAATVMERSLNHYFGPPCALNTKISELKELTM